MAYLVIKKCSHALRKTIAGAGHQHNLNFRYGTNKQTTMQKLEEGGELEKGLTQNLQKKK